MVVRREITFGTKTYLITCMSIWSLFWTHFALKTLGSFTTVLETFPAVDEKATK